MAAVVPFVVAGSALLGASSARKAGKAAQKASEQDAEIARRNGEIAWDNALREAKQQERETYMRLGQVRASAGKSGVTADSANVLDVIADVAIQSKLEHQSIIRAGGQLKEGFSIQSARDLSAGAAAKSAAYSRAGAALLGGAADTYTAFQRV